MALPLGVRLGPYELIALAGAGGMGEVYRARDTRLDRTISSSGLGVLGRNQYVVTANGQRFLINQPSTTSPPITVVTNWMASLRR